MDDSFNPLVGSDQGFNPLTISDQGSDDNSGTTLGGSNPQNFSALQSIQTAPVQPTPQPRPTNAAGILSGIALSLVKHASDAAAATRDVRAGQGFLSGFAKAAEASQQRQAQEKQQSLQQDEFAERKRLDDATIAHSQVQTLLTQQQLRMLGNDEKQKAYDSDQNMLADLTAAQITPKVSNLNDEGILAYMKANPKSHLIPISDGLNRETDKDGNVFLRPTYSLFDKDGTVTVGKDVGAEFDKYAPQTASWVGYQMPLIQYAALKKKMDLVQTQDLSRQKLLAGIAKDTADAEKIKQETGDKKTQDQLAVDLAPVLSKFNQNPLAATAALQKVIDAAAANPKNLQLVNQAKDAADTQKKIQQYITPTGMERLQQQAETERHNRADEGLRAQEIRTKADAGSSKPVYAFNRQTNQLEQTTKGDVTSNPSVYSNPVDVKEADIRKDTDLARQLGDAQLNLSRYRAAANNVDSLGLGDKRAIAALLGEDKFKAHFLGIELPADWANNLLTEENWRMLSPTAQDAVIGYIGARGAVIAYQKAVSGSGRANKEQLQLELQNIPSPILPKEVREAQFNRFQQNIDQTGAGLPKMVGVDRPQEIRKRVEAEEQQKQQAGQATHVYDPNTKTITPINRQQVPAGATPIKNRAGNAIVGYTDLNGNRVMFGGPQ